MKVRVYASPQAFKHALADRLRTVSKDGLDLARRRQLLVFDRFLARVVALFGNAVTQKGGLVLELPPGASQTTKDVDLRMQGDPTDLLGRLQQAGRVELGDFMRFGVVADPQHPEILNEGLQYDGLRFRAECQLAGMLFGQPFGVDLVFGDPVIGEPDVVMAEDVLGFAGVAPPALQLYPVETHIAEKLHAYTLPRDRPNSRMKDLPDLALLATVRSIEAARLRAALEQTFAFRATHALPPILPDPPAIWARAYEAVARANELPWATLDAVANAARTFLDPLLACSPVATWSPAAGQWS